jgi:membrane protein implicated in regulation of membrane protease activity
MRASAPGPLFHAPTIPDPGLPTVVGALAASFLLPALMVGLAVLIIVLLVQTRRAVARVEARLDRVLEPSSDDDAGPLVR